jgi:hypothetical protein
VIPWEAADIVSVAVVFQATFAVQNYWVQGGIIGLGRRFAIDQQVAADFLRDVSPPTVGPTVTGKTPATEYPVQSVPWDGQDQRGANAKVSTFTLRPGQFDQ